MGGIQRETTGIGMHYSLTYWRDLRILILENECSAKG